MRKFLLLLFLYVFSISSSVAQFADEYSVYAEQEKTFFNLSALQRLTNPIYRKATKVELETIAPNPQLFQKYGAFLKQSDTGLTKLAADAGCAESTKVVVATEDCMKYTMPGAGFSYSFRIDNYRIPRLADILFTNNSFQASGILLHGIFVNIGDVPLDKVNLQTKGMKYLTDFQPEPDYEKGKKISEKLSEGIEKNGFLYRRGLFIKDDSTFVLRSIAYSGKYFRAVNHITYNEFDFDRRRDIIVVLRIVEKGEDGSVTILWKILAEEKSPRVIRPKDEKELSSWN